MVLGSLNIRYKTLINTIIFEVRYYIWLYRNKMKFENKSYLCFKRKHRLSNLVY